MFLNKLLYHLINLTPFIPPNVCSKQGWNIALAGERPYINCKKRLTPSSVINAVKLCACLDNCTCVSVFLKTIFEKYLAPFMLSIKLSKVCIGNFSCFKALFISRAPKQIQILLFYVGLTTISPTHGWGVSTLFIIFSFSSSWSFGLIFSRNGKVVYLIFVE